MGKRLRGESVALAPLDCDFHYPYLSSVVAIRSRSIRRRRRRSIICLACQIIPYFSRPQVAIKLIANLKQDGHKRGRKQIAIQNHIPLKHNTRHATLNENTIINSSNSSSTKPLPPPALWSAHSDVSRPVVYSDWATLIIATIVNVHREDSLSQSNEQQPKTIS